MNTPPSSGSGPYAGYDSLEEAITGLRRGRFRVIRTFRLAERGLVVEGDIMEGQVANGMVLLPSHERHDNIVVPLTIAGVEFVDHPKGVAHVGLVLGELTPELAPNLSTGTILDVLESSPAA